MVNPTTEQQLAAAIRNLTLVYAAVNRIEASMPPAAVQLVLQELKHLSSPYGISILGKV